jgi:endonuclease YncB( thermonuclease family)
MGANSWAGLVVAILVLPIVLGASGSRAGPLVIEGPAEVVDNATVEIWGQRIRLAGIAVPDPQSEDGLKGKRILERLLADIRVRCEMQGPSTQTTLSGRCFAARVDIAQHLVQMGLAWPIAGVAEPSRR